MDLVKLEQDVLDFWHRDKVFEKSLKTRQGKPAFVFYEGPPSANAPPGIHHVLARAFKDLIPRFRTMQGYYVVRRAGWDAHGLPIEVQAEKELGLKSKKDIEKFGVTKFNDYCRKLVFRYQKDWEKLTRRIGFWLDLEHPYITYENDYIENLWGIIKKFYDKGLLYKGRKVVPHCPRCGSTLSSHEVALGYKDVTEPAVYVKFKILDGKYKDNYILAWTTTPWTLPGNVALAVGRKIDYVRAKVGINWYIIAKSIIAKSRKNFLPVTLRVQPVNLSELIGSHYQPLYPVIAQKTKDIYTIVTADFVGAQEGTGVVHTAVMYGEDDYELGKKYDLPKVHTVADDGTFKDFVKLFFGKFVKDADQDIIADLESRGLLYKKENYTHSYPFCWRCETPLLYYAKDSWFVKMSALRQELLKNNDKIKWVPEHLGDGRFGEFLKEAKDWAFSRERYWGTPLPVWQCNQCSAVEVVGSTDEICSKFQLSISNFQINSKSQNSKPLKIENCKLKITDLHRPYVDHITWQCQKCKGVMKREPYVVDVWFDSGAMPYASGEKQTGRFPADFIAEAIDQTRGWFYTLLAVATALDDVAPYKSVISTGHVLDEKGEKMSKSKGNVVDPWEVIEKHGADSLRWYFYVMNQPGDNKSFVEKDLVTYKNKTLGLLWNVYNYYETYSKIKSQKLKVKSESQKFKVLDQWIVARLHQTIKDMSDNLENYQITEAARAIMALIDDTSTWYLRRSRGRTDQRFFETLREVLLTIAKLVAPFMPFNAEALYQKIKNQKSKIKESVHLEDWPNSNLKLINQKLLNDMSAARQIVSQGLKIRSEAQIKVRQPLAKFEIPNSEFQKELLELIADEVNVKQVVIDKKLELDTKVTPELEQEGIAREIIRSIQDLRKQAEYQFHETVKAFYQSKVGKVSKAIEIHQKAIEQETLTKLTKGIPTKFDRELKTDTLHLAVAR